MAKLTVSIAIPTLHRGAILVETIESLMSGGEGSEILIVDQTPQHPAEVADRLIAWEAHGRIRWIKCERPSIPAAMNVALRAAAGEVVLFLDDDVIPANGLAAAHAANYADPQVVAVAGQVIQPWQSPSNVPRPKHRSGIWEDLDFPFHSVKRAVVRNGMAGNLSVRRDLALTAGGFDEKFIGAAYRFETEFCRRLTKCSGKIVFDPKASVRHLKAHSGGIRIYGDGITSGGIEHNTPDYYFAFLESSGVERLYYISSRIVRETRKRHFIKHPWKIPRHMLIQVKSILNARALYRDKKREYEAQEPSAARVL